MNSRFLLLSILLGLVTACTAPGAEAVSITELPDPSMYALTMAELPDIGLSWEETYDQTTEEQGCKWSYLAYQATQPGEVGGVLASAYAVNNDVILCEASFKRQDLPQPPDTLGSLKDISWKNVPQLRQLGDKSAMWKTTLGDLMTPVWLLEFYQDHAYVRIRLFGFPDQMASSILDELGTTLTSRLPTSVDRLRSDAARQDATALPPQSTTTP